MIETVSFAPKRFASLLLFLLSCVQAQTLAAQEATGVTVSYTPYSMGAMPVVKITLNGNVQADFFLDTAFNVSTMSKELAQKLGLTVKDAVDTSGKPLMLDGEQLKAVEGVQTKLANMILPGTFIVRDRWQYSLLTGQRVDGIIGMNCLTAKTLFLDPESHQLTLWAGSISEAQRKTLPLSRGYVFQAHKDDDGFLSLPVNFNDKITTDLVLDTGGGGTAIPAKVAKYLKASGVKEEKNQSKVKTYFGVYNVHRLVLDRVTLNTTTGTNIKMFNMQVDYFEKDIKNYSSNHIGMDVLSQVYTLIDFNTLQVCLKPLADREYDAGLGFTVDFLPPNQMIVTETEGSSSAQEAGLQKDDEIIKIDGQPLPADVEDLQKLLALKMRQPEGSKIVLTVKRKGEANPLDLTLTFRKPKK